MMPNLPPNLDTITAKICHAYNVPPAEVRSSNRMPEYCRVRHMVIYIALWVGYNRDVVACYFGRTRGVTYASQKVAAKLINGNNTLEQILEYIQ